MGAAAFRGLGLDREMGSRAPREVGSGKEGRAGAAGPGCGRPLQPRENREL